MTIIELEWSLKTIAYILMGGTILVSAMVVIQMISMWMTTRKLKRRRKGDKIKGQIFPYMGR